MISVVRWLRAKQLFCGGPGALCCETTNEMQFDLSKRRLEIILHLPEMSSGVSGDPKIGFFAWDHPKGAQA